MLLINLFHVLYYVVVVVYFFEQLRNALVYVKIVIFKFIRSLFSSSSVRSRIKNKLKRKENHYLFYPVYVSKLLRGKWVCFLTWSSLEMMSKDKSSHNMKWLFHTVLIIILLHTLYIYLIVVVICKCKKKNYYSSDCFCGSKIDFCIAFSTHNHYTPIPTNHHTFINVYTEKNKIQPNTAKQKYTKMLPTPFWPKTY